MTKPTPALTKTCSVCGLQKPLSAFLQMQDKQGATYGSVCSTCRHERKNGLTVGKEETTTTSSTVTIDSKAKVKLDTAKEDLFEKVETEYHEERDKNEVLESQEIKKTDQIQKEEKKHRETFLSRRPSVSSDKQFTTNKAGESHQVAEKSAQEALGAEKTTQQESATKQEQKEKNVDLTSSADTQIGKIKFREGESFKAFSARETSSAIARIFGKQAQQPQAPQKQQPSSSTTWQPASTQSKDQQGKPADKIENEGPGEFAERKWGPRSR